MTVLFLHVVPLLCVKSLTPCLSRGGGGGGRRVFLWTDVHLPPQKPASETKPTFLSTNLAGLLAFGW